MAFTKIRGPKIASIATCVPAKSVDNLKDTSEFSEEEVRKVIAMAGVFKRRVAGDSICSRDLCVAAAELALSSLQWERESIDAIIMVTQTPDYILPSTSCLIQRDLKLSDRCAAFDVGLGCSGYPYGLWLASMILNSNGFHRVILLHGDTCSRYVDITDRSVSLLFGDAGSATALEAGDTDNRAEWFFGLHTDGEGYNYMIIEAGGFRNRFSQNKRDYCVRMQGANVFNFTIKRLPGLIQETLQGSGLEQDKIDYYIFHQSNKYIINFLGNKLKLPKGKIPLTLGEFGNTGGPSIPLTITQGNLCRPQDRSLTMMLLGYGVGLSWGSALITLGPDALLRHIELETSKEKGND